MPPADRTVADPVLTPLFKRQLSALTILWITAVSVVAWLVFAGRQVALERGEQATAALSAVLEKQAERTFQAIKLTLAAVGDAHQLRPRPQKNDPDFQQMLARRLEDVPFARAIFIIGPDGWVLHDTDYPATPVVSLADRPYFRVYERNAAYPDAFWPPVLSRSGTSWFLPATHGLSRSGDFEGVVVAALQAEHFREQFQNIGLGDAYSMALFGSDGTLVARQPALETKVGVRSHELSMFVSRLPVNSGTFWSAEGVLPEDRIVSYRAVPGTPFVVQVTHSKSDVLAEWRHTATGAAIAMLALTGLLAWFIARMSREDTRREYARQKSAQAEKLQALGQLTGGLAHDFSNVLNIIGMNLSLLRQRPTDASVMEDALQRTERAVRDGALVTERLLSFARKKPLKLARVRLDIWLEGVRPLLAQAAGSGVTLTVEAHGPVPDVYCDTGQLDMALVNLVVNARDAMGGSGCITVRAYPCDDNETGTPTESPATPPPFVCLTVEDTGPGMSERVRKRAPEPFYTTKGEGGTGLGLSQVYGFMQQLGGSLAIESVADRGTAVHLAFPIAAAEARARFEEGNDAGSGASSC